MDLIIDVETHGSRTVYNAIKNHSKVTTITEPAAYHMGQMFSQIRISSELGADAWDDIFYKAKYGLAVIGVVEVDEEGRVI